MLNICQYRFALWTSHKSKIDSYGLIVARKVNLIDDCQ